MLVSRSDAPPAPRPPAAGGGALRAQAAALESLLFAEMLRAAGSGAPRIAGAPSQFDSFLRTARAEALGAASRTGLADAIYRSLSREDGG